VPNWLEERRDEARVVYESTPLPTLRDERWRYTSLRGIDFDAYRAVAEPPSGALGATLLGGLESSGELQQVGQPQCLVDAGGNEVGCAGDVVQEGGVGPLGGDRGAHEEAVGTTCYDLDEQPLRILRVAAGAPLQRRIQVVEKRGVSHPGGRRARA